MNEYSKFLWYDWLVEPHERGKSKLSGLVEQARQDILTLS